MKTKENKELLLKKKRVNEYTMRSVVEDTARKYKNYIALKIYDDDTTEITFANMKAMVDSFAMYLINKGFEKGDKIAILSENRPQWLIAYFGITTVGCIAVPILPDFSEKEINDILIHSESKAIVVSSKYVERTMEFGKDDHVVFRADDLFHIPNDEFQKLTNPKEFTELAGVDASHKYQKEVTAGTIKKSKKDKKRKSETFLHKDLKERAPGEDDIASIIYTSGTTGTPKGVMLTHKNIVWNADESTDNYEKLKKGYRVLSILPMSHVYSFTIDQILTMLCGCEINYLVKPPAASILMQAFKIVRPEVINTVPLLMEKIYKSSIMPQLKNNSKIKFWLRFKPTRSMIMRAVGRKLKTTMGGKVKFYGIGGAPLDSDVEKFLYDAKFPYAIGYGLTETSPLVAGCGPKNHKVGFIGRVVPHESVRLSDVNQDGVGEIEVKGPNVMVGYYKNEELTKEVFTEDGYFKTGDLGYFNKKKKLAIKGRSKTMILGASGENIYPESIEAKFNNLDFVEETLVVPDNGGLVAMIRLNLESFKENIAMDMKDAKMSIEDVKKEAVKYLKSLRESVNKDLQRSSQIDDVELQEEPFKRTPTQKIKRFLYNRKDNNKSK